MKNIPLQCYYEIAAHCKEAIFIFDKAGAIVHCNTVAEEETSYKDELRGTSVCDVFPELVEMKNGVAVWKTEAREVETSAYRRNKTCYPVKVSLVAMEDDEIAGIIISTDYTEQKLSVAVPLFHVGFKEIPVSREEELATQMGLGPGKTSRITAVTPRQWMMRSLLLFVRGFRRVLTKRDLLRRTAKSTL